MTIPRILAVAGSDSGGGAGIQADIRTITALGGHAMTAVTAITAQNTLGVDRVEITSPDMVLAQIDAVVRDIGVDAVKIGMIGSAEIANAVADRLDPSRAGHRNAPAMPVVLDPVMIATSGAVLADDAVVAGLMRLATRATLITPNLPELEVLTGERIEDVEGLGFAAHSLAVRLETAVLAKGGHLPGSHVEDVLAWPSATSGIKWTDMRIETRHSHGTGCTLSSAIAYALGAGMHVTTAIGEARRFVRAALLAAPGLGGGHGPMGQGLVRPSYPSSSS